VLSGTNGYPENDAGFAMVAAMTSGSSLSFAAPWSKRLLSAPHASKAAFIDGAAIASKNPSEVWYVWRSCHQPVYRATSWMSSKYSAGSRTSYG
jgi:hypothetical protein